MATITVANNVRLSVAPPDQFFPNTTGVVLPTGNTQIEALVDVAGMPANTNMGFEIEYGYTISGVTTWRSGGGATFNSSQLTDINDVPASVCGVVFSIPQSPYPSLVRVRSYLCSNAGRATYSAVLT